VFYVGIYFFINKWGDFYFNGLNLSFKHRDCILYKLLFVFSTSILRMNL